MDQDLWLARYLELGHTNWHDLAIEEPSADGEQDREKTKKGPVGRVEKTAEKVEEP